MKAVPTRRLTCGGFSPVVSGYSFGSLPVNSCENHVSTSTLTISLQTDDSPFMRGRGEKKKQEPQKRERKGNWLFTASLRQIFFSSFILWSKESWMSFSFFFRSDIFSFFWSSFISESAEPVKRAFLLLWLFTSWMSIPSVPFPVNSLRQIKAANR